MVTDNSPALSINEQISQRREKLKKIRSQGNAYPNDFHRNCLSQELLDSYSGDDTEVLQEKHIEVKIAGRIMTKRVMGKASFVHIQDMSGKIQIYIKQSDLKDGLYEQFLSWDLGDIVGVCGVVFKTKTGELSVRAQDLFLLAKSLLPMPEKFHGLVDQETRYRQRYLDLISNPETRKVFEIRSRIITAMREFFVARGFLEVETPMMHPIPGGASARPFITHHNTLDMQLYLRIAPELYLKQLVVGGMEKVFEINRCFRNEGISVRHNPEFTTVEFYQAYADYHDLMNFTEEMLRYLASEVLGTTTIKYQGSEFDLSHPFTRITMKDAIVQHNPDVSGADLDDINKARKIAENLGITVMDGCGLGKIQYGIFEKTVEKELKDPTFITAYPAEVSPLARANDQDPFLTDRFEFFVGGREIANGFSELNDPEDQASRFRKQADELASGDQEAMHYDENYITALEYGLPPTAGEGIGIDRLIMFFTDAPSIRDVILFPLLRTLA
ncbi:MAG: lysine--tRNA ligase [Gammaproteobacteria bacterium]|nr:lysine--tRNA ligase [Gammaproteobacteria bacterium]